MDSKDSDLTAQMPRLVLAFHDCIHVIMPYDLFLYGLIQMF